MAPKSPRTRPRRVAALLLGTMIAGLTACSTGNGPTDEPSTVACSRPGSQDTTATEYLGLTESQARTRATGEQKRLDIIGQDGNCQAAMDLNINTKRVQVYLEHGKITWSKVG